MQQRPNKSELLLAIAQFLEGEIKPALKSNPALAFRALIAANLAGTMAAEIWAEDSLLGTELTRLRALIPDVDLGDAAEATPAKRAAIAKLTGVLAERIRAGKFDAEGLKRARAAIRANLTDAIAVTNPRFDTNAEVP